MQIKDLMRRQNYQDYAVNDAQSFPQCLPINPNATPPQQKPNESGGAYFDRYKNWAKLNLSPEGQRIYDSAAGAGR